MTEEQKQMLRDELIEKKSIASSNYNNEDPFVGIYLNDLYDNNFI